MDLLQMLKEAQAYKPKESICQKCNDTGRDKKFICSCNAWDREAKKRAGEQTRK